MASKTTQPVFCDNPANLVVWKINMAVMVTTRLLCLIFLLGNNYGVGGASSGQQKPSGGDRNRGKTRKDFLWKVLPLIKRWLIKKEVHTNTLFLLLLQEEKTLI